MFIHLELLRFSESVENKDRDERGDEQQDPHQDGRHQLHLELRAQTTFKLWIRFPDSIVL